MLDIELKLDIKSEHNNASQESAGTTSNLQVKTERTLDYKDTTPSSTMLGAGDEHEISSARDESDYWTFEECASVDEEFWTFEEIAFSCQKCDFVGDSKSDLSLHVADAHPASEDEETNILLTENLQCQECPFVGKTRGDLIGHKVKLHGQKAKVRKQYSSIEYKCSDCDFIAIGTRKLTNHALDVHKKILKINKNPRVNMKSDSLTLVKDQVCRHCPYATAYKYNLRKHENAVHLKEKKFKCNLCEYTTYYSTMLRTHKIRHVKLGRDNIKRKKINCPECNFNTLSDIKMRQHKKKAHGIPYNFMCNICGRDFYLRSQLKRHERTHNKIQDDQKCDFNSSETDGQCDFQTSSDKNMRKHKKITHRIPYYFMCNICGHDFSMKSRLMHHQKVHHRTATVDMQCSYCEFEADKLELLETHLQELHKDKVKPVSCEKCTFSTFHRPTMVIHTNYMHDLKCRLCSYVGATATKIRQHITAKHERKQLKCTECEFQTVNGPKMTKHKKLVHGVRYDHVCQGCDRDFLRVSLLRLHEKRHLGLAHLKKKGDKIGRTKKKEEVVCKHCDFQSTSCKKLTEHEKKIHGVPYKFVCESCGHDFKANYDLIRHKKVHDKTRQKKRRCGFCTYETDDLRSARRHQNQIHGKIKFEMKCLLCKFETDKLEILETHLQESHKDDVTSVSCEKCQFSAFHRPTMAVHMNTMHDVKCELCSYVGATMTRLKAHISLAHIKKKG